MKRSKTMIACTLAGLGLATLAGCDEQFRQQFRDAAVPGLTDAAAQVAGAVVNGNDRAAIDAASTTGWNAVFEGVAAMFRAGSTPSGANTGDSVTSGRNTR